MKDRYLEVTFRNGKAVAGYFYLPRNEGDHAVRSERREHGLVVDYAADGRAIGIEITSFKAAEVEDVLGLLQELNITGATSEELAPLAAV